MDEVFIQVATANAKATVRTDHIGTKEYRVAPAVILLEGVHNGNHGPLYYPWDEIAQTPAAWNSRPIVIHHPSDGVETACTPEFLSTNGVGMLLNTAARGGKLKTEAWFDPEALARIDDRVDMAVNRQLVMEVSTGLFMNVEKKIGDWHGEQYVGVARNYRPDHLAVLPDQIGACSVKDGAGLMRNAENRRIWTPSSWAKDFALVLGMAGITADVQPVTNTLGFDAIREQLRGLIKPRYSKTDIWVVEVYNEFCVYEANGKLYKQDYTIAKDIVALKGAAEEVVRLVQYKSKSGTIISNSSKESAMKQKDAIDALIANGQCKETDRAELEKLGESTLSALAEAAIKSKTDLTRIEASITNKVSEAVAAAVAKGAAGMQPQVQPQVQPQTTAAKNAEQYINEAPPEVGRVLRSGLSTYNAQVDAAVATIMKHPGNKFTAEQLKAKELDELQRIESLMAAPAQAPANPILNFRGQGDPAGTSVVTNQKPLEVPAYNFEPGK